MTRVPLGCLTKPVSARRGRKPEAKRFSGADPCPGGCQKGDEVVTHRWSCALVGRHLDLRVVERGLVLDREPTGWGEPQAIALAVEDREDPAVSDLISRRLPGIGRGGAARKNSEISHEQESGMKCGPQGVVGV